MRVIRNKSGNLERIYGRKGRSPEQSIICILRNLFRIVPVSRVLNFSCCVE